MFVRYEGGIIEEVESFNKRNNKKVLITGETIEDVILPGDLIVDSDKQKKLCKDTFFINGYHYWSIKPIRELYVHDSIGMFKQIAGYDNKKRKLVLL